VLFERDAINAITNTPRKRTTTILIPNEIGIHKGANTHTQLQEIKPVNFKPMNKIVSKGKNPIPLEPLLL